MSQRARPTESHFVSWSASLAREASQLERQREQQQAKPKGGILDDGSVLAGARIRMRNAHAAVTAVRNTDLGFTGDSSAAGAVNAHVYPFATVQQWLSTLHK